MKLEKYVDKSVKKRKIVVISISVIVLISVSLLLYKTFASFTENFEFPVMNGKVDYFGNSDVYFAFYKGDQELEEMPSKDNEEDLVFDYGECDNGANIIWNSEEWAPLVKNLSKSKTKCSLYFKEKTSINICNKYGNDSALCYISKLGDSDYVNMTYDHVSANGVLDNNLRYIGKNPNNYIDIGDRDGEDKPILWRIIGVMNNITSLDDEEKQESLVKIIRAESIGNYSWDSSASGVNNGNGVNEWSDSDVMKLLNPNTVYNGTPAIGGSLYWNRESGKCYSGTSETQKACNFTSSGLSEESKKRIVKVRWNTATEGEGYSNSKITAKYMYEGERSNHNGRELCEGLGNVECNDEVERSITWDGYIGLMYPSDYGYAVGGNDRAECLGYSMRYYDSGNCNINDWLHTKKSVWTMTPVAREAFSQSTYVAESSGVVYRLTCRDAYEIMPVVYLKSSVKITGGTGEIGSPFIAELK